MTDLDQAAREEIKHQIEAGELLAGGVIESGRRGGDPLVGPLTVGEVLSCVGGLDAAGVMAAADIGADVRLDHLSRNRIDALKAALDVARGGDRPARASLLKLPRKALDSRAEALGVEDPSGLSNKDEVIDAMERIASQ